MSFVALLLWSLLIVYHAAAAAAVVPCVSHARDDREGIAAILSKRKPDFYKA